MAKQCGGGAVQLVLTDVTLDDLWRLDLKKLQGWECINDNTAGPSPPPPLRPLQNTFVRCQWLQHHGHCSDASAWLLLLAVLVAVV